ncbi:beta-L-arabinofuranosidase domain-containing protein [Algoriphagus sp. CAU 1675]|uniref:beta-L-arabinofuranosidase domain-containing protein n=1 Tax=Algoriphagus sp. CAU 1675 TaxID=3032597 RepID=UPI0023DB3B70|nr:beta-L-arabinofuranosidase domain-containing protein [Algoriphagus sp. CAU 1675]MDF2158484.1 glycoside hydrolase family 127 protein [Algoriphagus sp. CAU 1675]
MKKSVLLLASLGILAACAPIEKEENQDLSAHYLTNRQPLHPNPYLELPLGSIKAEGWLEDQLQRMANGLTGHLDEIYPEVVGPRNGWLGGDGDGWERGPYWIDGLLPLAYILDDEQLKQKVKPWIEWTLANQVENGYLGPIPFETEPEPEPGLQRGRRKDWWPKMVMLKVLQQYYQATGDERVITALSKYFRYQLEELPNHPLDFLSFWANRRAGDNLQVVYWLYNITGESFLLELGDLIQQQTFPWEQVYTNAENEVEFSDTWHYNKIKGFPFDSSEINNLNLAQIPGLHTVNIAQGLKQPIIYFQKSKDTDAIASVKTALEKIKKYHGQPQGMYGGDEPLHGNSPVQGIEFCSISEEMYSLESILKITGDMEFADLLEKITYNALPTQASDDFTSRQYFQAANQVELTDQLVTSYEKDNHQGTDFAFGVLSGFPCCTTNMHQSWPKFVQNLFYATPDGGVAALLYAPSSVELTVGTGAILKIKESTGFPFRETIRFDLELSEEAYFPFHLRIPSWTEKATIHVNGESVDWTTQKGVAIIKRTWKSGDQISLTLPMQLRSSEWYQSMVALERGPLVYSLKIQSEEKTKDRNDRFRSFTEIFPTEAWNFGITKNTLSDLSNSIRVIEKEWDGSYPWNLENAPIELQLTGVQLPEWKTVNSAPLLPDSWPQTISSTELAKREKPITLIPYGCTTLRITEFPLIETK